MFHRIELCGRRFGRLTVLGKSTERGKHGATYYLCLCSCGTFSRVRAGHLLTGTIKSCGCLRIETSKKIGEKNKANLWHLQEEKNNPSYSHGGSYTRLYKTWDGMKYRCYNPSAKGYENYGGRGIGVCPEWKDDFIPFRNWALGNEYGDTLCIHRKDNDGNYEPSNCEFIGKPEHARISNMQRGGRTRDERINT